MISLLPPTARREIIYARRNTILARWAIILFLFAIGLAVITIFGDIYIRNSIVAYQTQIHDTKQQLANQNLASAESKLQDISNNVKLVNKVLSKEVLFSKLLKQMGAVMPAGTVLDNLQISGGIEGSLTIDARATSYTTATQIQVNLADPSSKLFDKVDIVNIDCSAASKSTTDPLSAAYPCRVQLVGLFTDHNPFLFVNSSPSENN